MSGAAVGLLAGLAIPVSTLAGLLAASAGGAVILLAGVLALARRHDDDPARGAHLALASSAGLAALPASAASLLQLRPGARVWLGLLVALLVPALWRASRVRGPGVGPLRQLGVAACWLGGAAVGAGLVAIAIAAAGGSGRVDAGGRADAIYEVDAQVETRALPRCGDAPAAVRELSDRGARPRLDPDAPALWLDALSDDGTRQVHRLDLDTGDVVCWTCGEPGNNVRPAPGHRALVFETDRHADWRDPGNTELHLVRTGVDGAKEPSRRLTRAPGPDGHPLMAPGSGRVVWSRRGRGFEVVWAPIQSAHGALLLGTATPLARGGTRWLVTAAWSPDARALALASGNPYGTLDGRLLDPATGAAEEIGEDLVAGGVAFSADGGVMVVAGTSRASGGGLLPAAIGALAAPIATRIARDGSLHRGTQLRIGRVGGTLRALPAPGVERFGAPTGVALSADGVIVYLAQRSVDGARERVVEIRSDCR